MDAKGKNGSQVLPYGQKEAFGALWIWGEPRFLTCVPEPDIWWLTYFHPSLSVLCVGLVPLVKGKGCGFCVV